MKKLFLLLACGLLLSMASVDSSEKIFSICWVTVTTTNTQTGQQTSETYYSTSRTSREDCQAGAEALASGNFMASADFKRSPVLAP